MFSLSVSRTFVRAQRGCKDSDFFLKLRNMRDIFLLTRGSTTSYRGPGAMSSDGF